MPLFIKALAPGFDPDRQMLAVQMSRIILLQSLFFAWSFIVGALLNAKRHFTTYALAPLIYNICQIAGAILYLHFGIFALGFGIVVGALLHSAIQFGEVWSIGYRPHFNLHRSPELRNIVTLMIPRSLSQGMGQLVLFVYRNLASYFQKGSISVFNAMNDLQTTPSVIVGNSLATAFFPALSSAVGEGNWNAMNELLDKAIRSALFLLLPSVVLGFILRAQIVRLYIGIGSASWGLTTTAISVFLFFLIGIIPAALVTILARVFYAYKDSNTPMYVSMVSALLAVTVAYLGITHWHNGVETLALSESLISLTQLVLFMAILQSRDHLNLSFRYLVRWGVTYGFGAVLASGATWGVLRIIDLLYSFTSTLSTSHVIGLLLQMSVAALVGIVVYFGYSSLVAPEELQWIKSRLFTRSTKPLS